MTKWRPLSRRGDESYDALVEGVPSWLQSTLTEFVVSRITVSGNIGLAPHRAMLQKAERELRWPLDWTHGAESAIETIWSVVRSNPDSLLDFVDFCLKSLEFYESDVAHQLAEQFKEAGSVWTVDDVDGRFALVRRVDQAVADAAKAVMSSAGRAGKHLAKAWGHVYGRQPEPSTAYREAVRAVEAVGIPVISPRNPTATLGTMIKDMGSAPAKWAVVLKPKVGDPVLMIRETMELLWTAELDRHGTADENVPLHVSAEEAEAAIHLAVTLVHWFHNGAIKARK